MPGPTRARRAFRRLSALWGGGPLADCGEAEPALRYRDIGWSLDQTSPDQARIEVALEGLAHSGTRLLHVGVGGSALARRLAGRGVVLEGLAALETERARAEGLCLPGYRVVVGNKYGRALAALPGPYDVIVDNNPSSFACCRRHVGALLSAYAARLAPGGRILTDRAGLRYHEPYAFGLGWADWVEYGAQNRLVAEQLDADVWALLLPTD